MTGAGATAPAVSVVLVHYRTPELLPATLSAVGAQLDELGLEHELLVVDNSGDAAAAGPLEPPGVRVLHPGANLGYAGGLVAGVEASRGEALVLMNPDVLVGAGCLGALLDPLTRDAEVAGPRFYWDEERRLLLPPGEERDLPAELLRALATRSPAVAGLARRRWRRHARRHWQARQPIESWTLSGALLALRRGTWERVGPFDTGYPLYFEETDWLIRARRRGVRALHVPAATAVHHFDQSAQGEPRAQHWYAESCRRFRRRHYGRLATRVLERTEAASGAPAGLAAWPPLEDLRGPLCVEVSPRACGFPAAAEPSVAEPSAWSLPATIRDRHPKLALHVTLCAGAGREVGRYTLAGGSPSRVD
ncbi:MAG TPA: glycosyltransferase family 2 protein [Thermoanaerobaculia bacterium]|nr:glycosyltransferase family 2 protein [Thermoanaerobaculia bacterium]